jgi:hypothetical protein
MIKISASFKLVLASLMCIILSSCAVVKATNQPGKKDLSVLHKGTPRANVIAELGKPVNTESKNGHTTDVFSFVQGYSKVNKTARALGHGVADVFTLGLWEVAGTPIEGIANGHTVQVEIVYDNKQRVSKVNVLKGNDARRVVHKARA